MDSKDNEITRSEAKIYKRLYELYKESAHKMQWFALNASQYRKADDPELHLILTKIGDSTAWDSCGILSNKNAMLIKEFENLLTNG